MTALPSKYNQQATEDGIWQKQKTYNCYLLGERKIEHGDDDECMNNREVERERCYKLHIDDVH